jgi:hypothetical protein
MYGFLTLYLAFAIRSDALTAQLAGMTLKQPAALGAVAGALALGSFIATAIGTRLRIHRPAVLQATGIVMVAALAALTALAHTLVVVLALCLVTAIASGLAKLAVDAVIGERIGERVRATAFAHSETLLMLAWVAGGGLGLIPFGEHWGFYVAAGLAVAGAAWAVVAAFGQRRDQLRGAPADDRLEVADEAAAASSGKTSAAGAGRAGTANAGKPRGKGVEGAVGTGAGAAGPGAAGPGTAGAGAAGPGAAGAGAAKPSAPAARGAGSSVGGASAAPAAPSPRSTMETEELTINSPGFHLYRPSGIDPADPMDDPDESSR